MSFAVYFILLLYASLKLDRMLKRTNPDVSQFMEYDVRSSDEKVNLHEWGFQFAFAIEGYRDEQLKDDPRFVKGFAKMRGKKQGKKFEKIIPYHKCTESDWENFPPPAQSAQSSLESYLEDPDRNLYCLDQEILREEVTIWGTERDPSNYQQFQFLFTPCNYINSDDDFVSDECIPDLQKQIDYLGQMNLVIYYADQSFVEQSYEEETISVRSRFINRQIDNQTPSSIVGELVLNELEDEVSYLQYGQFDAYSFYTLGLSQPRSSSWAIYPTRYKFMSFEIHLSLDRQQVNR